VCCGVVCCGVYQILWILMGESGKLEDLELIVFFFVCERGIRGLGWMIVQFNFDETSFLSFSELTWASAWSLY